MRAVRWPALVVIVAVIVAALLFAGGKKSQTSGQVAVSAASVGPVVAPVDAQSALWFCNGGTAVDNGFADHRVVLINTTDASRTGVLTTYASAAVNGKRAVPVRTPWMLAGGARTEYRLAELIGQSGYASAAVEVDGGGVLVEHSVTGALGSDRGPCSSRASNTWFVPIGTTATVSDPPTARELLVFFNPFPGDAVVDVAFSTDTGVRGSPELFKGLVVPGGSVLGVDLAGSGVAVAAEVAAAITTRSGRVVVDRVQGFNDKTRRGLALSSGVGAAAPAWVFAAGQLTSARQERVVVYNPNAGPVDVDVEVRPQDHALAVEPFQLTVRAGQHSQIDLQGEKRLASLVAASADYALVVRSADGSPIVVERLVTVTPGSPGAGAASSTGSAVATTRAYSDVVDATDPSSHLVIVNPNLTSIALVHLEVHTGGAVTTPAKYASVELPPGGRLVVPTSELGSGTFTVVIVASAPVVAERELVSASDRMVAAAVPDAASTSPLDLGELASLGN